MGYSKVHTHTMPELQILELGLQLAYNHKFFPLDVETDSTEVIESFNYSHPIYASCVESCRSLLKKLGNPPLRHNFRDANKIADVLAEEGSKLTSNMTNILLVHTPLLRKQQMGNAGEETTKLVDRSIRN
ncbi:hypothetical protein HAX54_048290, partial [Datura stramonium]|nr:hypothetical protein [Datura stramonium]